MMNGISECCRYCTDRYPACHDHCEKYLDARDKWETHKSHIKAAKEEGDALYIYKLDKIRKRRKVNGK